MPLDRIIPTSASSGPVTGPAFMDEVQEELTGLWNAAVVQLDSVAGTAGALTATVTPPLTAGVQAGMAFWLMPVVDGDAAPTLAIDGLAAIALVDDDGAPLAPGALRAGRRHLLMADGTALRVFGSAAVQKITDQQAFTADGTWFKPAGCPDEALVIVEGLSPGGGGGAGTMASGGGGGRYAVQILRAGDLSASVDVVVGLGGAVGAAGGTTSFGDLLTIYGGGPGTGLTTSSNSAAGGAGGGLFQAGAAGVLNKREYTAPGDPQSGGGGFFPDVVSPQPVHGQDAVDGGGGGGPGVGSSTAGTAGNGGRSINGGGGGGGARSNGTNNGSGGVSLNAGDGGNAGAPGQIPGGGGGANAPGARGYLRVRTIG